MVLPLKPAAGKEDWGYRSQPGEEQNSGSECQAPDPEFWNFPVTRWM